MTDTQILTLALVFVAAIGSIVYNNSRITDLRNDMNARISDLRDSVNQHVDNKFRLLDAKLDHIIERLATFDAGMTTLEGRQ